MKLRKYTLEQLKEAIKTSQSYRQALEKLNIIPAGGNYSTIRRAVKYFDLNIDHFTGRAWRKGRTFAPKRPLSDYLENKQTIQSYKLKKRLLKDGIFKPLCQTCGNSHWLNKPIPLELHHIDGNNNNNNINNLKILCANCHALTDTYRAKNVSS